MIFVLKVVFASVVISSLSWLSGKKPEFAGFLTALPLTSLLALAFSQLEWQDSSRSVDYAKSIFVAIPLSSLFFVPFLFAHRFGLSFWQTYASGVVFLSIGFFLHKYSMILLSYSDGV
ncbi:MAG: hypothetical protein GY909_10420 [Oligoflexia bacterium]|nr:hypothetical protein [Bacteroidota bacterium]MCP4913522.1 hypothetical protein [Oligoflexia bacterium]MEC9282387.1 hypothetical protein [Bdellovibrionota bacterium]|tara:strand:+ start:814 stop:1167 length:354 start_codon:yes stop_codon:yes gene_type:complete